MAMIVQHNLTAMNSNRMLGITTGAQAKSSEKLSSGYRINRAADDAAGLTISEKMRKQMRGLDRASTNAQDGVSAVQTAEGALTEVHSMLQRMNELAVQSANGTNSTTDRDAIQAEINQLYTEINRVSTTTKFNETYLLKGDEAKGQKTVYSYKQVDVDSTFAPKTAGTQFYAAGATTAFADDDAVKAALDNGDTIYTGAQPARQTADEVTGMTITHASGAVGTNNGGFTGVTVTNDELATGTYTYSSSDSAWHNAAGDAVTGIAVTGGSAVNNDTVTITEASITGKTGDVYAADGKTALTNPEILAMHVADNSVKFYTTAAADQTAAVAGTDYDYTPATKQMAKLYDDTGKEVKAADIADLLKAGKLYADKNQTTAVTEADIANYTNSSKVNEDLEFNLHVGADSSDDNKIGVRIAQMSSAGIGLGAGLDVSSEETATAAIDIISAAIQQVSSQRSALGAIQNRLEHTIANLDNVVENTTAAESRIRDTDMAEEMVEYSKNNILAQAGQSMLAQANQSTQGVLSLLG